MEEKLIKAVKAHPCLYDKSTRLFRNKYLKDRAWQTVAASTGVSEEHCRSRWKSLRDRFVRELAARKFQSGAAAEEKEEWCYMEAMRFLSKHVSFRKTASDIQWESDQQPQNSDMNNTFELIEYDSSVDTVQKPNTSKRQHFDNFELIENDSSDTVQKPKRSKRQRLGTESRERFDRLCGTIEAVIASKIEKVPSKNSAFLQMLDECLQKKPEEIQDRLKIELLTYVHNAK